MRRSPRYGCALPKKEPRGPTERGNDHPGCPALGAPGTASAHSGFRAVPDYTISVEAEDLSREEAEVLHFDNDADALLAGADMLSEHHCSVAVARGTGDEAEWLGAWDWHAGGRRWTPDE